MKQSVSPLLLAYLLAAAAPVISHGAGAPAEQALQHYEKNPFYFQYEGEPVLLLGTSKKDNLFQIPDLEAHLDALVRTGVNYIRNGMHARTRMGYEVKPYEQVNGKYDLGQWNEEYWNRFGKLLELTQERDIIVHIDVFDKWDFSHRPEGYEGNPWRPANNITYTAAESGMPDEVTAAPIGTCARLDECEEFMRQCPFFRSTPTLDNNTTLLPLQEAFVRKMLSYSLQYDHVIYQISNEISLCFPADWSRHFCQLIRETAAAQGKHVQIAEQWSNCEGERGTVPSRYHYDGLSTYADITKYSGPDRQPQWQKVMDVRAWIVQRPGPPWPMTAQKLWGNNATDDKQQREQIRAFWRHLFAGSAAVRFHRYDKVPPEPFFHCVSAARKLADLIDLWETEPHPDRLTEREPDEAYLMADPGRSYAVYFPRRGSVELNLEDVSGTFTRQWIDITTGRFAEKDTVEGNAAVILSTPDRHSGWAVVLQKAGSER